MDPIFLFDKPSQHRVRPGVPCLGRLYRRVRADSQTVRLVCCKCGVYVSPSRAYFEAHYKKVPPDVIPEVDGVL